MTLSVFQANLAALVRSHQTWQPEGDLTPEELASLRALAADAEVAKYAQEQQQQRWLSTWRKLPRLGAVVGEDLLRDLWAWGFDPVHQLVPSDASSLAGTYTRAFLAWLLESPVVAQELAAARMPAWVRDVMEFERAELELTLPVELGRFRVVALDFDLLTPGEPTPRRTLAALVRRGTGQKPRVFEIDAAFAAVLRGLDGSGPRVEPNAQARADLRTMGLTAG